jgi:Protein of unknown function (DUF2795)
VVSVGEPIQGREQYNRRLDDELARDPGDEEETPDPDLWDTPGHDGIVSDSESDPDRTDLRSAIGRYVSLVPFPAEAHALVAMAEKRDAPDEVLAELRRLDPHARFANTAELWGALGLGSGKRF